MEVSRKDRIQYLARENRGRLRQPAYAGELARALSIESTDLMVFSLAETDRFFEQFSSSYESALNGHLVIWRGTESDNELPFPAIFETLSRDKEQAILFPREFEDCGALGLTSSILFRNIGPLLSLDEDNVRSCSRSFESGFYLDRFEEDEEHGTVWKLDLLVWGKWAQLLPGPVSS